MPESELNDESIPELEDEEVLGVIGLHPSDPLNDDGVTGDPRYLPDNGVRCRGVEKGWCGCRGWLMIMVCIQRPQKLCFCIKIKYFSSQQSLFFNFDSTAHLDIL